MPGGVSEDSLYRLAFAQAPVGIALVSPEGVWLEVNHELCRLLACGPEELRGQPVAAWVEPGDCRLLERLLDPEGRSDEEHELHLRSSRGERLTVCSRASFVEPAPEGGALVLQLRDVTEERRAEAELRESEQRFRLLAENMSDMVAVHAPDGTPLYVSPSSQTLLGYAPEALLEQPPFCLTHPDDVPRVRRAQRQLIAQRAPVTVVCRLRRADGSYLWCEMTGAPILDERGEVRQIQTATRDISERVAHQAQLARSREEERLRLARELHDGPVQELISLNYQLARLEKAVAAEGEARELPAALQQLRQGVVEVVRQLRGAISELRPAELDEAGFEAALERYLAKLERQHQGALPEVRLELEGSWDDLSEPVKTSLFRVLQEGLANALKHARASTVTVRLARGDFQVLLSVVDDGRGFVVPEDFRELTERDHFGLAGVAERVRSLGGALELRSSPEQGSDLSVILPLREEDILHG